jgi:hypothetical protein
LFPQAATGTTLAVSASTPLAGVDLVTFTATVADMAPGTGIPTGTVDFYDTTAGRDLGNAILVNGVATLTAGPFSAGNHSITATYGGDDTFQSSAGNAAITALNVSEVTAFVVQKGLHERSFVRYLDVTFASAGDVIDPSQVRLTRYGLDGGGVGTDVPLAGLITISGGRLSVDFGAQGIGGNRNSNAGDGYYKLTLDLDGDGVFETTRTFYRLFGDANGDHKVDSADASFILAAYGQTGSLLEGDVNGDGVVNSMDRTYAAREAAYGFYLSPGLWLDD